MTTRPGPLIASVGSQDVLYASWNALFRSDDRARKWHRLTCGLQVTGVAVSRRDPSNIYVATEAQEFGHRGGGLLRSKDGGRTWRRLVNFRALHRESDAGLDLNAVEVDPNAATTVYAAPALGGLEISRDGGENWRFSKIASRGPETNGPIVTSIAINPIGRIFVGTGRYGVFTADKDALRWRSAGLDGLSVDKILNDAERRGVLYAIATANCPGTMTRSQCVRIHSVGSAWRSVDNGKRWKPIAGLPRTIMGFAPGRGEVVAWSETRLWSSRDHGITWKPLPLLPPRD